MGLEKKARFCSHNASGYLDPRQQTSLKLSLTVSKMEITLLHCLQIDNFKMRKKKLISAWTFLDTSNTEFKSLLLL